MICYYETLITFERTQRRWYLNHETHARTNSGERPYQSHLAMSFNGLEHAIGWNEGEPGP